MFLESSWLDSYGVSIVANKLQASMMLAHVYSTELSVSRSLRRERAVNAVSCQISDEPQPLDIVHVVKYKCGTYLDKFTRIAVSWLRLPHPGGHGGYRTTEGLGYPFSAAHDTTYRLVCSVGDSAVKMVLYSLGVSARRNTRHNK